jgi:hypothetical protein
MMARSVFHDLFLEEEAAELEMRAKLLSGINQWLNKSGLIQTETAARSTWRYSGSGIGDQERKDHSVQPKHARPLAQRAGLRPGIKLQKATA